MNNKMGAEIQAQTLVDNKILELAEEVHSRVLRNMGLPVIDEVLDSVWAVVEEQMRNCIESLKKEVRNNSI